MINQRFPWQTQINLRLSELLKANRFPQSLILSGVEGLGKFHLSQCLAQALLCEDTSIDGSHCNQCASCRLFDAGTHPDFLLLEPEGKAQQIKISQVRKLNEFTQQTSQLSGKQVIIISQAQEMNTSASNALLKTLEEPTKNTVLILVTSKSQRLLMTIRSRCQCLEIIAPSTDDSIQWLLEQGADTKKAKLALYLSSAAPLKALKLIDDDVLQEFELWSTVWTKFCAKKLDFQEMNTQLKAVTVDLQLFFAHLFFCGLCKTILSDNESMDEVFPLQQCIDVDVRAVYQLIDAIALLQVQRRIVTGVNLELQWQRIVIDWLRLIYSI